MPSTLDPELRRQLDIEATEKFIREQKRRGAELDLKEKQESERALAAYEEECRREEQRELIARDKERKLWEAKEKIKLTQELGTYICRRIASGEMLKAICAEHTMPSFELMQDWFEMPEYDWFHKAYMRATVRRDKAFEDEIVMISDDSSNDYIEKVNTKTGETFRQIDPEALTRSKMRIDTRLRIMKANNPARWGDNPNAGAATQELLKNIRPIVNMTFIEAPKDFARGNDAKVIEHQPDKPLATPPWELDKDDLEYIRRRDEKVNSKTKVA